MTISVENPKSPPFILTVIQITAVVVVIVVILGLALDWQTQVKYSDAFFWAALICTGFALGGAMAFSGAVIHSIYHRYGKENTMPENLRADYQKTRPTRRFAGQMLATAAICLLISILLGL
jgi:uncharacterized membrane protein